MFSEEQQQDHIQIINYQFNKEECDVCHGSGVAGDGTCSSCNGKGII